jgi:N-acetylmuramic acid 6-phosphate etherase
VQILPEFYESKNIQVLCLMKTTEQSSLYDRLEDMSSLELVQNINAEDQKVALAVGAILPQVAKLIDALYERMKKGGRLFYIGSGTSGRLGILDASECPPTYGVPHGMVIGLIAGGDSAIRKAVEQAEDNTEQAWLDLMAHNINAKDTVIGISASGTTPYVLGGLKKCQEHNILTGCVVCNVDSPIEAVSNHPLVAVVGPEFVTGSTRMKAGTAQKMMLNMITTGVMVRLGKVKGNKMVDMQLTNEKLVNRGIRMIMEETGVDQFTAEKALQEFGHVRSAIQHLSHK